jgi:NAD(P)-dependent dehydrogenase (short-subunit alcohol dehydrogenase family)
MRLKDRIAIVTGGSSGIGRGICLEFAREGARVVVADVQEEPKRGKWHDTDLATTTVAEIEKLGSAGLFVATDMGEEADVRNMVDRAVAHYGALDIVVNNAGIHIPGNSQELSVAAWDRVMGVNLRGIFLATKFAVPHLKESKAGRIINVASVHAFRGGGGPVYPPAKAGVVNLTRDTAVEVAADSITVNAICPGYIETPIQDYLAAEDIETCRAKTPLPRLGLPRDIGRACVFYASDDAEWVTGTALPVDGGWLAPII